MSQLDTIFEGAAGLSGYENAYQGAPYRPNAWPGMGSEPLHPPGGRPPFGAQPDGLMPVPGYGPPLVDPAPAPSFLASVPTWVWGVAAAAAAFGVWKLSQSDEELAANDDDDGDDYQRNTASVAFMKPYTANGGDDDEEDEDEEDDDWDEDDESEEDEDDSEPLSANAAPQLTSNTAGVSRKTARIMAELSAIQNAHLLGLAHGRDQRVH